MSTLVSARVSSLPSRAAASQTCTASFPANRAAEPATDVPETDVHAINDESQSKPTASRAGEVLWPFTAPSLRGFGLSREPGDAALFVLDVFKHFLGVAQVAALGVQVLHEGQAPFGGVKAGFEGSAFGVAP